MVSVSTESTDPRTAVDPEDDLPPGLWAKARHLVVHRILRLDDTPHRIAFGVFLGFVVGATPTIGFQMIIYVAFATLLRANKVSGILPVWMSNPITAVPLYYTNWRIGQFLLTGELSNSDATKEAISRMMGGVSSELGFVDRMMSAAFWSDVFDLFVSMGAELWVGSFFVGFVLGVPAYWAAYRGVIAYRARRE